MARTLRRLAAAAAAAVMASLAACGALPSAGDRVGKVQQEQFGSTTMHSRDFGALGAATCEAARRALLSQGYVLSLADAEHVKGRKNFQPDAATHLEIEFNVVCAPADRQGRRSIAFVNALQERYALKKSNNSASLGVGVLGSVSLPFSSSDDSMVRVASETIAIEPFYDRFFALVDRYLIADASEDVVPEPKTIGNTEPKPAGGSASAPSSAGTPPSLAVPPSAAAPAGAAAVAGAATAAGAAAAPSAAAVASPSASAAAASASAAPATPSAAASAAPAASAPARTPETRGANTS